MPKVKRTGEIVTWKEWFHLWKLGITNLTPQQRTSNERNATVISLVGFIASLIVMIIFRDKFLVSWFAYGLIVVFLGSIYSNILKFLSLNQMLRELKKQDSESVNIDDLMSKVDIALNPIEKALDKTPETKIRRIDLKKEEEK